MRIATEIVLTKEQREGLMKLANSKLTSVEIGAARPHRSSVSRRVAKHKYCREPERGARTGIALAESLC